MRRSSVAGIALILVLSGLAFVTIIPGAVTATRYVGGVGPGNFTSIQAAVSAAAAGETVYVYPGVYRENVYLVNGVRLVGEDRDTTIIDGRNSGATVDVTSPGVGVRGFTITNGAPALRINGVSGVTVADNILSNSYTGLQVYYAVGAVIVDNLVSSNRGNGIEVVSSASVRIARNTASSNELSGIYLSAAVGNTIEDNLSPSNQRGIQLDSSSSNMIRRNTLWSNTIPNGYWPYVGAGVYLKSSSNNRIEGNNVSSNNPVGILLHYSSGNTLVGNTAASNQVGIHLETSSANTLLANIVSLNSDYGIRLISSSSNTLSDCTIAASYYGLQLSYAGNNTVVRNSISSNSQYGITLSFADSNVIHHNNFVGNARQASGGGDNRWDDGYPSGGNYWSDYQGEDVLGGPDQDIPGTDGIGDVLYFVSGTSIDRYPFMGPNPIPDAPPSQARNLLGVPRDRQVALTWDPPASDGGSPVLHYRLYRYSGYGYGYEFLLQLDVELSYTDSNLTNGQSYYYRVSASNIVGEGLQSNEARAIPATVPGPPRGVGAVPESRLVTLTWTSPADNGGSGVTNYHVHRGASPGALSLLATVGLVQQYLDIGLTNGVTYYYQVIAQNPVGNGTPSDMVAATPSATLTLPGPPTRLVAQAGDARVDLAWSVPGDNGGAVITNYAVYRGPFSGAETFLVEVGDVPAFSDRNVTNGVVYSYRVAAKNAVGEGPVSDSISVVPVTVPGAPIAFAVVAGNGRLTLTWLPPIDSGGSAITHYNLYRANASGGGTYLTTPGNLLHYEDTGLQNGVALFYQVAASNAVGEGPRSSEVSATPAPNQLPTCAITSPVSDATVADRYPVVGSAADAEGTVTLVEVRLGSGGWVAATGTTSWTHELDTRSLADAKHTLYVRAFDGTDWSAICSVTVTVRNAPLGDVPVTGHLWFWALVALTLLIVLLGVLYLRERRKPKPPQAAETPVERAEG